MPFFVGLAVSILLLAPPCYSIGLILFDTKTAPHQRTARALGYGLVLNATIIIVFASIGTGFALSAVSAVPISIAVLAILAAIRSVKLSIEEDNELNDLKRIIIDI